MEVVIVAATEAATHLYNKGEGQWGSGEYQRYSPSKPGASSINAAPSALSFEQLCTNGEGELNGGHARAQGLVDGLHR